MYNKVAGFSLYYFNTVCVVMFCYGCFDGIHSKCIKLLNIRKTDRADLNVQKALSYIIGIILVSISI